MATQRVIQWIAEEGGQRLDKYLTQELPGHSRSAIQKRIAQGLVLVNGQNARASYLVETGDAIQVFLPATESGVPQPEPIALDVVYEDQDLLVVNKPAGMVVHPAPGHRGGTLVNAILARCPHLAAQVSDRPGIVHRLDRGTSGLILVAKNERVQRQLQSQFRRRSIEKVYLALLEGRLQPTLGVIEAPIGRDPRHRQRMAVVAAGGRPARTSYQVQDYLDRYTLVEVRPETGRTHQIRVHFAAIGYPVVGDTIYGRQERPFSLQRHFLHAWRLTLALPGAGAKHTFTAPLPDDLQGVLDRLRRQEGNLAGFARSGD